MKTVGKLIRDARRAKKISLVELEERTKIKRAYISAIEKGMWGRLPEYPVVVGFVKNLAGQLGLDRRQVVALLRRDYPPMKEEQGISEVKERGLRWGPRQTFVVGVIGLVGVILGYLGYQYYKFTMPPKLEVWQPTEGQQVPEGLLEVRGKVSGGAVVSVNNQPVVVEDNGEFKTEVEVSEETGEVVVRASTRVEKETVVTRGIQVKN